MLLLFEVPCFGIPQTSPSQARNATPLGATAFPSAPRLWSPPAPRGGHPAKPLPCPPRGSPTPQILSGGEMGMLRALQPAVFVLAGCWGCQGSELSHSVVTVEVRAGGSGEDVAARSDGEALPASARGRELGFAGVLLYYLYLFYFFFCRWLNWR